jgi:hypothetical protein
MPSELVPGWREVTVKLSEKVPMGVMNDFVKAAPSVTGVGSVNVVVVPLVSPMLFRIIWVTVSGAPGVMVVAVVMSLVGADVKVPFGTKLKATWIGTAQAGDALRAATAITVLRRAVRREGILIIIFLKADLYGLGDISARAVPIAICGEDKLYFNTLRNMPRPRFNESVKIPDGFSAPLRRPKPVNPALSIT